MDPKRRECLRARGGELEAATLNSPLLADAATWAAVVCVQRHQRGMLTQGHQGGLPGPLGLTIA
jgi:hypothetical protein